VTKLTELTVLTISVCANLVVALKVNNAARVFLVVNTLDEALG
jgi:hypothetical protein